MTIWIGDWSWFFFSFFFLSSSLDTFLCFIFLNVKLKLNLGIFLFQMHCLKWEMGNMRKRGTRRVYWSDPQIYRLTKREKQMEAFVYNWEKAPLFVVGWTSTCAAITLYWTLSNKWNFLSIENFSAWCLSLFALPFIDAQIIRVRIPTKCLWI